MSFTKQRALIAVVLSRAGHAPVSKGGCVCQYLPNIAPRIKNKIKKTATTKQTTTKKKRNGEQIVVVPQNSPPNSVRQIVSYHKVSMHVSQHVHEVSTSQ